MTFALNSEAIARPSIWAGRNFQYFIERMHAFCARRGIRFIVVDIPQGTPAPYKFGKSVLFKTDAELVDASKLLAPYAGAVQAHLPHGHNHISEFTHALIGAELGRRITEKK